MCYTALLDRAFVADYIVLMLVLAVRSMIVPQACHYTEMCARQPATHTRATADNTTSCVVCVSLYNNPVLKYQPLSIYGQLRLQFHI